MYLKPDMPLAIKVSRQDLRHKFRTLTKRNVLALTLTGLRYIRPVSGLGLSGEEPRVTRLDAQVSWPRERISVEDANAGDPR